MDATGAVRPPQWPLSLADFRARVECVLQPRANAHVSVPHLEAGRLLLSYAYGLTHDELLEAALNDIDVRASALLDALVDENEELGGKDDFDALGDQSSLRERQSWAWIEAVYDQQHGTGPGIMAQEVQRIASSSSALLDLLKRGKHIRSSLHPYNLYRFVFHDLDLAATFRLLRVLRSAHLPQTRTLLACGASFASPQWALLTAVHPDIQRAELESLCAHLLERAHADSTSVRARFRLVSQALALAPPDQLRALLPQWNLVMREVEEALQGADPYADAATAAADAARGFGAGLGLGALPSVNIGDLGAGVRSWGASVGRMVSGVWR